MRSGGSQGRPEVEMNDCENLLRGKPQPAGVQIDRTDIQVCVCHTCSSLGEHCKLRNRLEERGGLGGDAKQSKVHFVVRSPNDVIKQIDAWLAQQERGVPEGEGW